MSDTNKLLDGITSQAGECICSHCQMDNLIDSIMPAKEEYNDQTVSVLEQLAP